MNAYQQAALKNHCRFAFETLNPKLVQMTRAYSVVLSVNSGYE